MPTSPQNNGSPGTPVSSVTPRGVAEIVLPAAAVQHVIDVLREELRRYVERIGEPEPAMQAAGV
jgi:hypothetical protein